MGTTSGAVPILNSHDVLRLTGGVCTGSLLVLLNDDATDGGGGLDSGVLDVYTTCPSGVGDRMGAKPMTALRDSRNAKVFAISWPKCCGSPISSGGVHGVRGVRGLLECMMLLLYTEKWSQITRNM